jgi:hypothetical protein
MRSLILVSLFLAAACSGEGGETKEEAAAESLDAGVWDARSEITAFRSTDKSKPAVRAAVGDKSVVQACVREAERTKPPASLFAGEDYDCKYKTSYTSGGRLNHTLECSRNGVAGSIPMLVNGTFRADSFEAEVTTQTFLPGTGDFYMLRKVTGHRTAPSCPPGLDDGKGKAGA